MTETSNLIIFLIGLPIGGVAALAGGLAEYVLHLRRNREPRLGVPGCLVFIAGGLGLAGIVAIIGSFALTGGIAPALVMGAGVLLGFYGVFILLVIAWLLLESLRSKDDKIASSDSSLP